jgi:branched-chain amino acid transport system ATP-binding protein
MAALLEIENLSKRFGGLQAVANVSFSVAEGTIKAIIGPNGAGKTTLFDLISGFQAPDTGTILFDHRPLHGLHPYQIAKRGVARTFQHVKLFSKMTALENIMIGRHTHSTAEFVSGMLNLWTRKEERAIDEKSMELMRFLGIPELAGIDAASLPYGQQRIVELARALACEPSLLLLDEPAAGLNIRETTQMARLISKIRDMGITVLVVEHDMSLVMNISDEILVLSYGQRIADDTPMAVQKNKEVVRIYLGEEDA